MESRYGGLNAGLASLGAGLSRGVLGGVAAIRQNERNAIADRRADEDARFRQLYYDLTKGQVDRNQQERERARAEKQDQDYIGAVMGGANPETATAFTTGAPGSQERRAAGVQVASQTTRNKALRRTNALQQIGLQVEAAQTAYERTLAKLKADPTTTPRDLSFAQESFTGAINELQNKARRIAAEHKLLTGEDLSGVYSFPDAPKIDVTTGPKLDIEQQKANAATTAARAAQVRANRPAAGGAGKLPLEFQAAQQEAALREQAAGRFRQQAVSLRNRAAANTIPEDQRQSLMQEADRADAQAADHEGRLQELYHVMGTGTRPQVNVSVTPRERTDQSESAADLDPLAYPARLAADKLQSAGATREQAAQALGEQGYDSDDIARILSFFPE